MADVTVVRYSFEGEKFEIMVKPDPALDYKLGKKKDISSVLVSEEIYTDSGKGTKPSTEKLLAAFKTEDKTEIAQIMFEKGDLNLTTDQRRKMVDQKRKQIVEYIAKTFVDPKTHLPHPPLRIEQAMKDGRVSIEPQKSVEEQVKGCAGRNVRGSIQNTPRYGSEENSSCSTGYFGNCRPRGSNPGSNCTGNRMRMCSQ